MALGRFCPGSVQEVLHGVRVCHGWLPASQMGGQLDELTISVTAERIWARAALMKQGDILGPGTDPQLLDDFD